MKLEYARRIATEVTRKLRQYCDRLEIAGSIRREKKEVKDIEVVCIPKEWPKPPSGLFPKAEMEYQRNSGFIKTVNQWGVVKGNAATGKYMQREIFIEPGDYPGMTESKIKIDIFTATPINYGLIKWLRTGSTEFNFKILEAIKDRYMVMKNGYLYLKGQETPISLPEEKDLFELLEMDFVEPHLR